MIETRICKKCDAEVHGFHRASDCKPAIEMIKRGGIDVMRCTKCGREWYAAENVKHTHEEQEPMKCPKCEAPIPPTPHKNHHCYRCGEPHPAIAQNEAAQRLAQLGGIDSSNTVSVTFGAAFTSEPACKVVDATTDALNTIATERARLRKIIETRDIEINALE